MAKRIAPAAAMPPPMAVSAPATERRATGYAYYALFLVVFANFFNYVDRQIVSIVGQRIKADLHLTDAQLGFLLGTAFAVFYGVIGIAMGRIADAVSRTRLMAVGLALWSGMTALAGVATGFGGLAAARLGVGIGEATASPCANSLLCDYFPPRNRAAVLATYLLGTYLGLAASLIGGGMILQHWSTLCQALPGEACRLADWRAAFLVVGLPGLVLAVLIAGLREPPRAAPPAAGPVAAVVLRELSAAVPPFTLAALRASGGAAAVRRNLLFAAALAAAAVLLTIAVGDWLQWAAVALGSYSIVTWGRVLSRRDPPLYRMTFGCKTFRSVAAGGALATCVLSAVQVWSAPYAMRVLGATPAQVGVALGLTAAAVCGVSVVVGGLLVDWWKRHDPRAPVWLTLFAVVAPVPALLMMLHATTLSGFVAANAVFLFLSSLWAGGISALAQDLVLPRMRGTAAAAISLTMILVGAGIGPYWAGKISTLTGSLAAGMASVLVLVPPAVLLLWAAARRLPAETADARRALARACGEPLP